MKGLPSFNHTLLNNLPSKTKYGVKQGRKENDCAKGETTTERMQSLFSVCCVEWVRQTFHRRKKKESTWASNRKVPSNVPRKKRPAAEKKNVWLERKRDCGRLSRIVTQKRGRNGWVFLLASFSIPFKQQKSIAWDFFRRRSSNVAFGEKVLCGHRPKKANMLGRFS